MHAPTYDIAFRIYAGLADERLHFQRRKSAERLLIKALNVMLEAEMAGCPIDSDGNWEQPR